MGYPTNLCNLMSKKGIGAYRLAKDIGVHTSTVSNWKEGASPKIEHLRLVADYFGVTIDELLADELQTEDTTVDVR